MNGRRFQGSCQGNGAPSRLAVCLAWLVAIALAAGIAEADEADETDEAPETLESLIDEHTATTDLLRAFDLTIRMYLDDDRNKPSPDPTSTWRWSREGRVERVRAIAHELPPRSDGLPDHLTDTFLDGLTARCLRNWSPENPQPITPLRQGSVHASFEPQTRRYPCAHNPGMALNLEFMISTADMRRSLGELAKNSAASELIGRERIGEFDTWHLRFTDPGNDGYFKDCRLDIYLDPSVGYLARRVVVHRENEKQANGTVPPPFDLIRDVAEFTDYGDGVYLPAKMETATSPVAPLYPNGISRLVVDNVTVNAPLPPDALDFRFPEHAQVRELPAVDGRYRVHLWGPDNKPRAVIRGAADLRQYEPKNEGRGARMRRRQ